MWLYVLRRRCSTFQTFDCIPFLSLLLLILPTIIITMVTQIMAWTLKVELKSRWWWHSLFMMTVWLWSEQLDRKSWWWQWWLWRLRLRWQWWCLRLSSWQSLSVKLMKSQIFAAHWTKLPCNYTVQKSQCNTQCTAVSVHKVSTLTSAQCSVMQST